jgi:two-component system response regulator MtrA
VIDVLLVEDDRSLRELMMIVFRDEGFTVRQVSTAAEALQAIATSQPDVMVIDVSLPGEDGAALCRTVKSNSATDGIRCLMWSALPDLAKVARAAHADGWMLKPSDLELLVARIRELASGRA